jgi:hypothetical protein
LYTQSSDSPLLKQKGIRACKEMDDRDGAPY